MSDEFNTEEDFDIVSGTTVTAEEIDQLFTDAFITANVLTPEKMQDLKRIVARYVDPLTDDLARFAKTAAFTAFRKATKSTILPEQFHEVFEDSDAYMELLTSYISLQGLKEIEHYWFSPFLEG